VLSALIENRRGGEMSSRIKKKGKADSETWQLSESDIRALLVLCAELVNFCAKVTGKIDPAAGAMLAYIRDNIRFESKSLLPYPIVCLTPATLTLRKKRKDPIRSYPDIK
jgi:hypothetical protein